MERAYATALLDSAPDIAAVEDVAAEIAEIRQLLRDQPDLVRLLSSRILGMRVRLASARKIFHGQVSDLVFRFLCVLVTRDRFDEFPGIAAAFLSLVDERHGEVPVDVSVARGLDDAALTDLAGRLGTLLDRKVRLSQRVDEGMIGGMKLRVGDEVYDGSISTQLRLLRDKLIEAGRQRARLDAAASM